MRRFATRCVASKATAASAAMPLMGTTAMRCQSTYFEMLENVWNTPWISASPRAAFIDQVGVSIDYLHDVVGWEYGMLLYAFGMAVRATTMYFSLYGERASARMQHAVPELEPHYKKFQDVMYDSKSTTLEIQVAATTLKKERNKIYLKWKTSNKGTLATLMGAPLVMMGLNAALTLSTDIDRSLIGSGFLWLPAVNLPDPTGALPIACSGMTLLNAELAMRAKPIDENQKLAGILMNTIRFGCVCLIPVAWLWPSGALLYWLGMSTVGLVQPMLLRVPAFRSAFGIPEPPAVAITADTIQSRMAYQVPYMTSMFFPESEEKVAERLSQQRIDKAREDAITGRITKSKYGAWKSSN